MSTPIITVANLGMRYRVRRPGNREGSGLRHALETGAKNLWKGFGQLGHHAGDVGGDDDLFAGSGSLGIPVGGTRRGGLALIQVVLAQRVE